MCSRVVAIGDLHGGYDAFVSMLRLTGLVDAELKWIATDSCLVQLGDTVDRGDRSRDIIELLMTLQRAAPEQVFHCLVTTRS